MTIKHRGGLPREQTALLPASVEDYVGAVSMVRVIDAWVERLDVFELGFRKSAVKGTGRPPYDPADLLRLYLYGYQQRIRSSRALERESRRNLEVMWRLRQLSFDHKTIADFRRDNATALHAAAAEFVQFVRRAGVLAEAQVVAIDGSKFKASAAVGSVVDEDSAASRRARLAQQIGEYLEQMDELDRAEAGEDDAHVQRLQEAAIRLLDRDYALAQAQERIAAQAAQPVADPIKPQTGLTDPDAVALRHGVAGYNVQLAVEESSKLVVAHEVTRHANDHRSLAPTAQAAQQALGGGPLTVVADTGYMNGAQAQRCEDAQITPVVPMQQPANPRGEQFYPKSEFAYEAEHDRYRCPDGQHLLRFKQSNTRQEDHYATDACGGCARKAQCTQAARRTIVRGWHEAAAQRAAARADKRWMRRRAATAEHPFGLLKALLPGGFLVRGLNKVRGEMALAVLAVNLRRATHLLGIERMMQCLTMSAQPAG